MVSLLALAIPSVMVLGAVTVMFCDVDSPFGFGLLYQLLAIYLPKAIRTILNFIPGGRFVLSCCTGTYDYVVNKPNPLMQTFFLGLVIGGFAVFVHYGLPMIPNKRLSYIHVPLPFILVLWTLFTFVLASVAPPGFVTPKNYAILEQVYPYDGFVFVKRDCPTCGTPKVARSKHCRMLGKCVEKYDHFCPWINNCVGALNYRYFLLFVGSTAAFLVYGTYVLAQLILWVIDRDRLWEVKFMNTGTRDIVDADWKIIVQFMMTSHGLLLFIFLLCLIMGITLVCFFLYQLYLVSHGTTANENAKWGDIADFYSSKKWEKELAQRGPDYTPDSELLKIDSDPLSERMLKDFPTKMPPNIYHKGFIANLKDVFWPESLKQKRLHAATLGKSGPTSASAGKTLTTTPAAVANTIGASKETNISSASKKKNQGKKNKKKD